MRSGRSLGRRIALERRRFAATSLDRATVFFSREAELTGAIRGMPAINIGAAHAGIAHENVPLRRRVDRSKPAGGDVVA